MLMSLCSWGKGHVCQSTYMKEKTTLDVGSHSPPCSRQGALLFVTVYWAS